MALEYVPTEGKVAIQILDDVDADDEEDQRTGVNPPSVDADNEALIAVCVGVGPKVTVCKRGDTVFVYKYARNGLKVGDDVVIVDFYCVAAKVKK